LKLDFDDPPSAVVATEFCGTSISSQGPSRRVVERIIAKNPHIKLANAERRGYTVLDITPQRCIATLRALNNVRDPSSGIYDLATFAVEDGKAGALRV
jgi:alkaline phosphatase D